MIISAKGISKAYGTDVILDEVSFHVNENDRIGIVGINGAGKTTLLKILAGEMEADSGDFFVASDTTIGYLRQNDRFSSQNTVIEQVTEIFRPFIKMEEDMAEMGAEIGRLSDEGKYEEAEALLVRQQELEEKFRDQGGYGYKGQITGILRSMAFDESFYDKKIDTLSGGERTRLALACLLLEKPDILFLDEPTNHLDIGTLKWLEQYLKSYQGAMIIVSHDRYFLDTTVNRIFEIENHRLKAYDGGYSDYAEKKRQLREEQLRKYSKQQAEIKRQEDMIRLMKQRGTEKFAKRALSREKRLEQVERVERPESEGRKMKIRFKENFKSGHDVYLAEDISKGFGYGSNRKQLFEHVDMDIKRGERVCIVGPNGVGKTTLLRILLEEIRPDTGYLKKGHNVDPGYYDQAQERLTGSNSLLEELQESYRLYSDTEMRAILGRFLFTDDTVFLTVDDLSGGEKARLSLVKLMLSGANVLIMDEPTNHLDINSKEVFEEALMDFPGTVIVVSHDRYFLNKIPTRILELGRDGMTEYLGKYDYYEEKRKQLTKSGKAYLSDMTKPEASDAKDKETAGEKTAAGSAEERRLKKEQEARERRLKRKKEALEADIEALEKRGAELEEQLEDPGISKDSKKLADISRQMEENKEKLDDLYEQWMELQEV